MSVLVDTSIWSLALRRRPETLSRPDRALTDSLAVIIRTGEAKIIGPIRQELLTGIRTGSQFATLKGRLRQFRDEPLVTEDFESAAQLSNRCIGAGIAVTDVDLLICAVASLRDWSVFSVDRDFLHYSRELKIRLHA